MRELALNPPDGRTPREAALAERAKLKARYPTLFEASWRRRGTTIGAIAALAEGRDPGDLPTIEDASALQQVRDALAAGGKG